MHATLDQGSKQGVRRGVYSDPHDELPAVASRTQHPICAATHRLKRMDPLPVKRESEHQPAMLRRCSGEEARQCPRNMSLIPHRYLPSKRDVPHTAQISSKQT